MVCHHLLVKGQRTCLTHPRIVFWYLGLIALAKFLSASHCKESRSQYKHYKKFLENNIDSESERMEASSAAVSKNKFKGFQGNRLGRIGEISEAVTAQHGLVEFFFEEQIDENQNKLVLAVAAYIQSEWFLLCSKVATYFVLNVLKVSSTI